MTSSRNAPWWQSAVIYQVYPRSFADADGDGVGDLEGIRRRLPYLRNLGVDAIWISPIFTSPMADFGYDVADYRGIDPLFGTMADFDRLLADAHAHGLKLLLDFVPNHTSDRHPWFEASRSGRPDPKRDWYIWRAPAPDGGLPNNWTSHFGGPAWTRDVASGQFYLHSFLPEQPDLNWRNPDVQAAMLDVLRFWFDKGVDGFRIDVLWLLVKDAAFRDNPPNPDWHPGRPDIERFRHVHDADQPETMAIVEAMRGLADRYGDRLLVGEIYLPVARLMAYYGLGGRGVQLPFNFQLIGAPWDAAVLARLIADYEAALPPGAWPNWVLGNHDQKRIAARVGEAQARIAAMLLLTLRGTPTLYYGDEIGLAGATIPPDRVRDPQALREPGIAFNRDEARTPMQWDESDGAGFSTAEPWLPLSSNHRIRNVAVQEDAPGSMLRLVKALLALRRREPALQHGSWHLIPTDGPVLAYERRLGDTRIAVYLNLSHEAQTAIKPDKHVAAVILLACQPEDTICPLDATLRLSPDQGFVLKLPSSE